MSSPTPIDIASVLALLSPDYAPTPLLDLPRLATRLDVAQVLVKDEGRRMLGSFKSLGGTYAGLRALARTAGTDIAGLLKSRPSGQPSLVCASDGNHGLAVASAARFAGTTAHIYLHATVPENRARRIAALGATIIRVQGTYDDAVDAAAKAAADGAFILIADTTDDPNDPVVRDVMAGYGVIASEIRQQAEQAGFLRPTHVFVQAGVGGLAAAMADGLGPWLAAPGAIVVVEPASAPAVAAALAAGRPVRVPGDLETTAGMLSCGEASGPALPALQRHKAQSLTVTEAALNDAPAVLRDCGGPPATTSGAAGLAGALTAKGLSPGCRLLLIVTEKDINER